MKQSKIVLGLIMSLVLLGVALIRLTAFNPASASTVPNKVHCNVASPYGNICVPDTWQYITRFVSDGHARSPFIHVPAIWQLKFECDGASPNDQYVIYHNGGIYLQSDMPCNNALHTITIHAQPDVIQLWASRQVDFQVWGWMLAPQKLMDWYSEGANGNHFSPPVDTTKYPSWTLKYTCSKDKMGYTTSMQLIVYSETALVEREQVVCDSKWHVEPFYQAKGIMHFMTDRRAHLEVYSGF